MRSKVKEMDTGVSVIDESQREINLVIDEKAHAMIMERLIAMYTNQQAAIVRELVSNAIDAAVLAGLGKEDKGFNIHSPAKYSPFFKVEDFGVGMSMREIEDVYTKYGSSTKVNDYNQIGAYGLGAKVPFCYTPTFTIVTTKNGKTITGIMSYLDGKMSLKIISHKQTGKPNGTIIEVPVKVEDIPKFEEAIKNYRMFKFSVPVDYDIF